MYIVAIAWIFVATMAAITDTSVLGGIITFLFWGLFPLALFLWIAGSGARRRRRAFLEQQALHSSMRHSDGRDPQRDQ